MNNNEHYRKYCVADEGGPVWTGYTESKQEAMHQFRCDNHMLGRPVKTAGVNFDVFLMDKTNADN